MPVTRVIVYLFCSAVIVGLGAGILRQSREAASLRAEIGRAQSERQSWRELQIERERLRARQIPAADLEQLRADHAALPRLRAELERLRTAGATPR